MNPDSLALGGVWFTITFLSCSILYRAGFKHGVESKKGATDSIKENNGGDTDE